MCYYLNVQFQGQRVNAIEAAMPYHIFLNTHHMKVRESNPGGGEIFRSRPDRPLGPTQPPIQGVPGPPTPI